MTRNETDDPAPARQRIAKLMARVGLCSRRDAEAWIIDGRVSVNGEVLTSPALDVGPSDAILVDGAPLPQAEKTRLFLFHKPRGLVTSDRDPEGRATVTDYLREHWPEGPRVVTIGRLDINTEGLLLLTNDGGLARLLELPKTGWMRRYRVRAKGETDQSVLDGLAEGIAIEGIDYAGIEAKLDRQQGANVWLTMGLREGKNREVKRVLEAIGLEVNRLIRLSFGPFQLGDLPEGAVEEVRTRVLRDQLGPALAEAAGAAFEDALPAVEQKPARQPREGKREALKRETPAHKNRRGETRAPRGGERPLRRGGGDRMLRRESETPQPIRERPAAGTRKHVTALRSEEAKTARKGPRRRIERSDVKDRRDRTIAVERLVDARPLAPTRTRDGGRPARDGEAQRGGKPGRHASPSAMAKRARVARSGGRETEARGQDHREPRRDDGAPRHRRREDTSGPRTMRPERERGGESRRSRAGQDERRDTMRPPGRAKPARHDERVPSRDEARERPRREGEARTARPPRGEGRATSAEDRPKRFASQRTEGRARPVRSGAGSARREGGGKPPSRSGGHGKTRGPDGAERGKPRRPSGDGRGKPRGPSGGGRGKPRPKG